MLPLCTFAGLPSSAAMTSSRRGGVGRESAGPLPSVNVSSHEIEKRKTSMLSEPRMTIGPGPAIDPDSVTEAKLKPPAETSNPARRAPGTGTGGTA